RQRPEPRLHFPELACYQLTEWIEHQPGGDAYGDIKGEAHQSYYTESRDRLSGIAEVDAHSRLQHEQSYDEQCRSISLCGYGGDQRSEEQAESKARGGHQGGEAGASTSFNPGSRFHKCSRGGGADGGREAGGQGIDHHGALDLWEIAFFVEEACTRREPDQSPHGVNQGHDEEGQHDGKCLPGEGPAKIELPQNGSDAGRPADDVFRTLRYARENGDHSRDQDSQKDPAGYLADGEYRENQKSCYRDQHRC